MELFLPSQVRTARALLRDIEATVERADDRLHTTSWTWVYCDLDECGIDSTPRSVHLLKSATSEIVREPALRQQILSKLQRITSREMPYLVDTLWEQVAGEAGAPYLGDVKAYWFERFFTNDMLAHDVPTPGAEAYLRRLRDRQALKIGYLTGRHEANPASRFPEGMRSGTLASLAKHRFPMNDLRMKGDFAIGDAHFKGGEFAAMIKEDKIPVIYFENEPEIANLHHRLMRERNIPSLTVFVHTKHKKDEQLDPGIRVLKGNFFL